MTSPEHSQRGKNSNKYRPDRPGLSIVKVPADSVPYGESISHNGRTVWAAYFNGSLVAVGYSADDARRGYRKWVSSHTKEAAVGRVG
jgi:hypothetical protein